MKDGLPVILFENEEEWERWLQENGNESGVWVRIAKKDSGITSITYQQAVDIGLCYGWIDGQKQKFDEKTFAQRFTPRKPNSNWSLVNKEKALQFIAEGKMKPAGWITIENAKKSGAWERAYESQSAMTVPEDLQKAFDENPKAEVFFKTLNSVNRYAVLYRIKIAKTDEQRAAKINEFISMLANGKKIYD